MNEQKAHYIDVSGMSERELCQTLNIKYVPWYMSTLFWALAVCFSLPSMVLIVEVLK